MATGHILPGFRNPVSRYRSKSADPTMTGYRYRTSGGTALDAPEFQAIKAEAMNAWTEDKIDWNKTPNKKPTTYGHSFYRKENVTEEKLAEMRPTSSLRRNKPHPKNVFLTCNLKTVPGYHDAHSAMGKELGTVHGFQNPDTTIQEEVYQVDSLCSPAEQRDRSHLRHKYMPRPRTANVLTYHTDSSTRRVINDPWSAQAAEAWMKLANERDRKAVRNMLERASVRGLQISHRGDHREPIPNKASSHRFLKAAGAGEAKSVDRLMQTLNTKPKSVPMSGPHYHITDYSNLEVPNYVRVNPKHCRTDYVIHPQFVP
ncbi:uncharacterized protein LOC115918488 [Strongylocentrotus purpuratus]|uniref:Uncharacterized protein n=1 Tax=Strongylocentrotus purpuratus TaxID=7668 RepID=A0A7M7SWH4_STRPU|nr:uncharacterized protein LOC115918488 [Strongylocentrotus purpuratus]|eukprot:XP_003723316.1 PREDICTED: uncharacterized protein LOC585591 [Strongylocentrotus purpuratus]